jgi:carbonic anhydrase
MPAAQDAGSDRARCSAERFRQADLMRLSTRTSFGPPSPVRRAVLGAVAALAYSFPNAPAFASAALCERGRRQSPIDIDAPTKSALPPLRFDYRAGPLRLVNDGHTVRVRCANGSELGIGRDRYALQQFHFHLPGGDRIAGEDFALGMHFTHKSGSGQLLALVLLFRLGAESAAMAALLPHLPERGLPERTVAGQAVNPAAWLPAQHGYYAYDGSLTGAPCTEGVRWVVLKQPLELSAAQLARLTTLIPNNARPVQPRNGRAILESD